MKKDNNGEFKKIGLYDVFKMETDSHIKKINSLLLALEKELENESYILEIFREIHSQKGAAKIAGAFEIERISAVFEDVLADLKNKKYKCAALFIDVFFEAIDLIGELINNIENCDKNKIERVCGILKKINETSGNYRHSQEIIETKNTNINLETERQSIKAIEQNTETGFLFESDTITVKVSDIDKFSNLLNELTVNKLKIETSIQTIKNFMGTLNKYAIDARNTFNELQNTPNEATRFQKIEAHIVNLANLDKDINIVQKNIADIYQRLNENYSETANITDNLYDEINKLRLVPVSLLFDIYPRVIRDMAKEKEKEINVEIIGRDVKLDRKILEIISASVMHLVRNAVEHGIELPEIREQHEKKREGLITFKAVSKNNQIFITISDDGSGIEKERLINKAIEKGAITNEAALEIDNDEIYNYLFLPGFSTKDKVSNLAGRGMGLDIVKQNIESIRGRIFIKSEENKGFSITLQLPVNLSVVTALLFNVGNIPVAVQMESIDKVIRIKDADIHSVENEHTITLDGEVISLIWLANALNIGAGSIKNSNEINGLAVVVVKIDNRRVAIAVDEVDRSIEIVIRPMDKRLGKIKFVTGAAMLGSGNIALVLDLMDILSYHETRGRNIFTEEQPKHSQIVSSVKTILLVEDSLTTRALEKNILTSAGFKVIEAVDGYEALRILNNEKVDLLITDIQMPRMDGYKLIENIKADKILKALPIIIVSARGNQEERRRGLELGADAYIVKTDFEEGNLINIARSLI